MHSRRTKRWIILAAMLLASSAIAAEQPPVATSNVAGKKLIRVAQEVLNHVTAEDVAGKIEAWQQTGYDGAAFTLSFDDETKGSMKYRWWDVSLRNRQELEAEIENFKSINNWGRFTDNFLWMTSYVQGHKPPDWFNDADWQIVLANARLGAQIAKEIGFKGIAFDVEGYGAGAYGVWRQPWDYPQYASNDYQIEKRDKPRSFEEVAAKVRQRGREWAEAISEEYPEMVLAVLPGLYEATWPDVTDSRSAGDLAKSKYGLWPAFIDGMLEGLDEKVQLVSFIEKTYLSSQYRDLAKWRDIAKEQALLVSAVPDLARRRISFAAGLWTDAGYGTSRFNNTNARANQREPQRHMHATHNALAVSDHYAWHWGEWGRNGESNFLTTEPTPLMREYWQANVDAHQPQDLDWEPQPHHDNADYTEANAQAAQAQTGFWGKMKKQGYAVAAVLPSDWKFRLDIEMLVRYSNYMTPEYDDSSWFEIKCTRCWQSQGAQANDIGLYRVKFDAPANLDPEKQEIVLTFGGLGHGRGHLLLNGKWTSWLKRTVDVSKAIKPGESNQVAIIFPNQSGPGGLMGQVKLLVRDRRM